MDTPQTRHLPPLALFNQRATQWLYASGLVAVVAVAASEWLLGKLHAVDRLAYPLLALWLAGMLVALRMAPQRLGTWQRLGAFGAVLYFASSTAMMALWPGLEPTAYQFSTLGSWVLACQLFVFVTWPPGKALAVSLLPAVAQAVSLGLRAWVEPASVAWIEPLVPLIINGSLAQSMGALALWGLARQIRRVVALAPWAPPAAERGWVTVDDLTRQRMAELDHSRRSAEQAAQAKSTFLANMSHEIRTPMNGIMGLAELLERSAVNDEQRRLTGLLRRSARAMLGLLNNVLDLSRADAGALSLEARDFDLRDLVRGCIDLHAPRALQKGLQLHSDIDPDVATRTCGDTLRLQQVLNNLVSNAIKFTAQGQVRVMLAPEPGLGPQGWRFEVLDTGIGVAKEKWERIFEPFIQADSSTVRKHGGSGLGLAIARRLVQAMGGQIGLDSRPGQGSRFWFTAKLMPPKAPPDQPPDSGFVQDTVPGFDLDEQPPTLKVLLVEDNEVNQLVGRQMIAQMGHEVEVASDGESAVQMADQRLFDAILMDCQMPGIDGWEATRRIRDQDARSGRPRTPILALTACAFPEDHQRCRDAGMDGLLAKPYTRDQLAEWLTGVAMGLPRGRLS